MKTIKVINILVDFANNEVSNVPKFIKYNNWNTNEYEVIYVDYSNLIDKLDKRDIFLNDEVEIVEDADGTPLDEEEKEIEKLDYKVEQLENPSHNESLLMNMIRQNKETINKLIEELKRDK